MTTYERKPHSVTAVQVAEDPSKSLQEVTDLVAPCWSTVKVSLSGDKSALLLDGFGVNGLDERALARPGNWVLATYQPSYVSETCVGVIGDLSFKELYSPTPAPATDAEQEPEALNLDEDHLLEAMTEGPLVTVLGQALVHPSESGSFTRPVEAVVQLVDGSVLKVIGVQLKDQKEREHHVPVRYLQLVLGEPL